MDFKDLAERSIKIKQAYDLLNRVEGAKKWGPNEYLQGLMGDLGDLSKLIMAKKGYRFDQKTNVDEALALELADCLWSIIIIADEFDIDLEDEFVKTIKKLESKISDRNVVKSKKSRKL